MRISWCIVLLLVGLVLSVSAATAVDYDSMADEAKSLALSGDLQAAIDRCNQVLDARPGAPAEPKARLLMGYIFIKKQAPAQAMQHFLKAADDFPDSPQAPEALLRAGYLRDKGGEQPLEWNSVVEKYPKSKEAAEALHRLGRVALRAGDPALAIQRFEQSAKLGDIAPEWTDESLVQAGYAHISEFFKTRQQTCLGQARVSLSALASSGDPSIAARAHMGIGETYLIQGYGRQAAEEYKAALDTQPEHPYVLGLAEYELASAFYCMREWKAALAAYDEFLAARPGQTLQDKDKQWKAIRPGYADLSLVNPAKADSLTGLGLIPAAVYWKASALFKLYEYQAAKQLAGDVLTTFPDSSVAAKAMALRDECAVMLGEVN